jgi:formamidopyrimidine-DNA glycosylase
MIELPEIETIRRDLDRESTGKRVKDVDVVIARAVGGASGKTKLVKAIDKAKVTAVSRVGKLIQVDFDTGYSLMFDLGSGGQLLRTANKDEVHKRTALVIAFTQHGQMRLVDMEADASVAVYETEALAEDVASMTPTGIDPIEEPMSWTDFGRELHSHQTKLRTLLMDDDFVIGLGTMYTDEILFHAGLRYDRLSNSLTTQEIRRLYRALVETIFDAVKYRGSSVAGSSYVDVFGEPGSYQDHHAVFQKEGSLSPRTRRPIVRSKFNKEWTYYCDQSQV